jgi:hypothetical protein
MLNYVGLTKSRLSNGDLGSEVPGSREPETGCVVALDQ